MSGNTSWRSRSQSNGPPGTVCPRRGQHPSWRTPRKACGEASLDLTHAAGLTARTLWTETIENEGIGPAGKGTVSRLRAALVSSCLEMGYTTWKVNGNKP